MPTRKAIPEYFAPLADLLLQLKARGASTTELAKAIAIAANEAGIFRLEINEAYEELGL